MKSNDNIYCLSPFKLDSNFNQSASYDDVDVPCSSRMLRRENKKELHLVLINAARRKRKQNSVDRSQMIKEFNDQFTHPIHIITTIQTTLICNDTNICQM